ncbi:MAG: histidinol-phosphate transaminase, partial [Euryarchaeota archaeon]|nr:histidinol-phosphate transaminase [Euryarchaeota archaeon]
MRYRASVELLGRYEAGEFPEDVAARYGIPAEGIVNLNSNENPYPLPESVVEAIAAAAAQASRYPNPGYAELRRGIAEYVGTEQSCIAVGAGAGELISHICTLFIEPLDRVLVPVPTYTMYAFYSMLRDASVEMLEPEAGVYPEPERIAERAGGARVVFLCSPNNPTGGVLEAGEVLGIAEATEGVVVVDEAYVEFCCRSAVELLEEAENLIVIRSFSKFFGLAGLRVGYAVADAETAERLERIRNPFCVSRVAEAAAIAALKEVEHFREVAKRIVRERERLREELARLQGLEVYPSHANFLLVRLVERSAAEVYGQLLRRGIIVRNVTGMPGLRGEYLRISVGT